MSQNRIRTVKREVIEKLRRFPSSNYKYLPTRQFAANSVCWKFKLMGHFHVAWFAIVEYDLNRYRFTNASVLDVARLKKFWPLPVPKHHVLELTGLFTELRDNTAALLDAIRLFEATVLLAAQSPFEPLDWGVYSYGRGCSNKFTLKAATD